MVDNIVTGYLSGVYARSLREWGKPIFLPGPRGWILRRPIPGTDYHDAIGVYPLLCCSNWLRLELAAWQLIGNMVSLVFVADPFADVGNTLWLDLYTPYKLHHIVDYGKKWTPSRHHRYYAKRAECDVEFIENPDLGAWCELYSNLIDRHDISGIRAFSTGSFEQQLRVPGLLAFEARDHTGATGMHLWYVQGDVAYSHLAACSERGYESFASYALMSAALNYFSGKVRAVDLGGVADGGSSGLEFFKKGWGNDVLPAYLCGKILDLAVYKELSHGKKTGYFPAYRG